ncbi:hypothetical protein JTB14_000023 [Gonioctena quinquepunctata]|nr:hypothetical protein JTB14_000023 [Gonioctena quinquepunctata]
MAKVLGLVPLLDSKKSRLSRSYILLFYTTFFIYYLFRQCPWFGGLIGTKLPASATTTLVSVVLGLLHFTGLIIQLNGALSSEFLWRKLLKYLSWHDSSMDYTHVTDIDLKFRVSVSVFCFIISISSTIYSYLEAKSYASTTTMIIIRTEEIVTLTQTILMSSIIYELCVLLKKRYDLLNDVVDKLIGISSRIRTNTMKKRNDCLIQGTSMETIHFVYKIGRIKCMTQVLYGTIELFNRVFGKYLLYSFFRTFADSTIVLNIFLGDHPSACNGQCWIFGQIFIKWERLTHSMRSIEQNAFEEPRSYFEILSENGESSWSRFPVELEEKQAF